MSKAHLAVGVIVGCLAWGVSMVAAGDWPQWRGANRDGKVTDFAAPQTWPKQLAPKWKVKIGSSDATPALVGDKLYVVARQDADEVILCLETATGKTLWQDKYPAGANVGGPASGHPGPRSSPAVAGGKVVTMGVGGVVSCLDAATGKVVWRKETAKDFPGGLPRFFAACSPLIVDGLCIVQVGGQGKGTVVAYDLAGGEVKWKADTDGTTYSSPVLMTVEGVKQVVSQNEKSLVGLAASDGKVLWQTATPIQGRAYNAATPVVDGQTVIYTGGGKGTKAFKVEKQGDGFAAKELWSNEQTGTNFNTPVVKEGVAFGLSDRGNVFALDAKTGKTLWTSSEALGQRGFGSIVDAGSVLIGLGSTSDLVAFKPSDKAYEEVAKIKLSEAQTYGHPVLAGKNIFVQDQDGVAAFALE
jgi:outer membrane protein assembly factor BamB